MKNKNEEYIGWIADYLQDLEYKYSERSMDREKFLLVNEILETIQEKYSEMVLGIPSDHEE
jgi:hypothetical protein